MMQGSRRRKEGVLRAEKSLREDGKGSLPRWEESLGTATARKLEGREGGGCSLMSDATERGEKRTEDSKGALGIH